MKGNSTCFVLDGSQFLDLIWLVSCTGRDGLVVRLGLLWLLRSCVVLSAKISVMNWTDVNPVYNFCYISNHPARMAADTPNLVAPAPQKLHPVERPISQIDYIRSPPSSLLCYTHLAAKVERRSVGHRVLLSRVAELVMT